MLFLEVTDRQTSSSQDVLELWPFPTAIHYSTLSPINPVDFFQLRTHCVTTIAGTLESTSNFMLRKLILQLIDRELQFGLDVAIHANKMSTGTDVGNWAVVTVILIID